MSDSTLGAHRWRFFRAGGFDQVRIETVEDLKALDQLDLKLWASLACPVKGLEFDERTLTYIDADGDGRIRVPEMLAAVRWTLAHLAEPGVLFRGRELPVSAIDATGEQGAQLIRSAQHILSNLGRPQAAALTVDDTADLAKIFPPDQPNGDGLVPATLTQDEAVKAAIQDVIDTLGAETDRSGEPAISQEKIEQFFTEAEALHAWHERLKADPSALMPLGENSEAAVEAYRVVAAKIDDFFIRTQFAAYDQRAQLLMNGSEADLSSLSAQALHAANEDALRMPLAQVMAERRLPLRHGVNPAWLLAVSAFREQVVRPLLGERDELAFAEWQDIQAKLQGHLAWLAEKPVVAIGTLPLERIEALLANDAKSILLALVERDKAVASESDSILDVDKLIRFQRYLVPLLNNFVALRDFYSGERKAVFQSGTLYLDGRSFDLCVQVNDAARHATLATFSRTYLAYCECTRKGSTEKLSIVAAVTAGSAGSLMVGRNGVFYDRKGQDWDATITKIVDNPISIREAFWSPYRRIGKMVSEQMQKMAASGDKSVNDKMAADIAKAPTAVPAAPGAAPAAPPAPFDIGKSVGIFAAIGLALGAIGTALASVLSSFAGLKAWQMPLAILGVLLLISGPAMILAWFKLRSRNLGPILDANGWAVNTQAKINIPFGTALSQLATLPKGAERSLSDPYSSRRQRVFWFVTIILVLLACVWGCRNGWFTVPAAEPKAPAAAKVAPPPGK